MSYIRILGLIIIATQFSCTNLFVGSAKKDTDAAKLFEARRKMDSYDWTGAITQILDLSAEYRARRDVKALLASAYAGRCGLDFLEIAENLQEPGNDNLFEILIRALPGTTTSQANDCITAETVIKTIDTNPAERLGDENLLMAFVGIAKMAALVSSNLDTDGDGAADDGVNPCTAIDNTEAAELITGLANTLVSLTQTGGSFAGDFSDGLQEICDTLDDIDPDYNVCAFTETSQVTAQEHRQLIRAIVRETDDGMGVGDCNGGVVDCLCGS